MRHKKTNVLWLAALLAACTSTPAATDAAMPGDAAIADDAAMADDAATGDDAAMGDDAGPAAETYIAITIGTLAGTPTEIQPMHDAVAGGGEAGARGAGNIHHEVFLGTTLLGTQMDQFLATDRWTNLDGARAVYSNPDFIAAFSTLFAAPTAPVLYARTDWHQWGDLDAADASTPRWFAVVQGTLASMDLAAMQTLHDAAASGGESAATGAGDVGHVVFLGVDDPSAFLAIDVWTSADAIEAVYTNPDFQAGLAGLFSAPPTIGIYESTTWHQW